MTAIALPELFERTADGKLRVHPHWGQQRILDCRARYVVAICGSQSGKSSITPVWTHGEIDRYPVCDREGEGDHIVSAPTYGLLDAKLVPAYRRYFVTDTGWGMFAAGRMMILSRRDKSRIVFRSAENPEALETFTARSAVCDEYGMASVSVTAWEAVQRRLRTTGGRALISTCAYTLGWLRQGPYALAVGGHPDYGLVSFPSNANPRFSDEQMEQARATMPAWKFALFHLGQFTRPAGLIYGDYEDAYAPQTGGPGEWREVDLSQWQEGISGHLVRPFTIPKEWLRQVGVDFGGTEHTALVWAADDPVIGNAYLYREALGGGYSGAEHARMAKEYKEPVRVAWGGAGSEDSDRRTWALAGFPVREPLVPEVEAGIDRVVALFRQRRLFVFDTLTNLRSELGTYSRELDAAGEPLMKIADKERFHGCDSLRYLAGAYRLDRPAVPGPDPLTFDPRSLARLRAEAKQDERQERVAAGAYRADYPDLEV